MEGEKVKKFNFFSKLTKLNSLFLILLVCLIIGFWSFGKMDYAKAATGINRELSYQGKIAY
jgi:hypothetical protein